MMVGEFYIYVMSIVELGNFIIVNVGDDGMFLGVYIVMASYCGDARDKE